MMSAPDSIMVWHCNKKLFSRYTVLFLYLSTTGGVSISFASCVFDFLLLCMCSNRVYISQLLLSVLKL